MILPCRVGSDRLCPSPVGIRRNGFPALGFLRKGRLVFQAIIAAILFFGLIFGSTIFGLVQTV